MRQNKNYRPSGAEKHITLEVTEDRKKLRLIFLIAFIALAAFAFAYAVHQMTSKKPGWNEITASGIPDGITSEYTFYYRLGETGRSATKEYRELSKAYSNALSLAFAALDPSDEHEAGGNLATLSGHPNEKVAIMPELFGALEAVSESGNRNIYLGPVFSLYWGVINSPDDATAALYDPFVSEGQGALYREVAAFADDENSVRIELSDNNTATLFISDEYMSFALENGIDEFLGLGWMKNAFAVDIIADILIADGYTNGVLSSYDGYGRSLGVDESLSNILFSMSETGPAQAAQLTYPGGAKRATVCLSAFPVSTADRARFYVYEDGRIRDSFLTTCGLSGELPARSGIESFFVYRDGGRCSDMVLDISGNLFGTAGGTFIAAENFFTYLKNGSDGFVYVENGKIVADCDAITAVEELISGE